MHLVIAHILQWLGFGLGVLALGGLGVLLLAWANDRWARREAHRRTVREPEQLDQ